MCSSDLKIFWLRVFESFRNPKTFQEIKHLFDEVSEKKFKERYRLSLRRNEAKISGLVGRYRCQGCERLFTKKHLRGHRLESSSSSTSTEHQSSSTDNTTACVKFEEKFIPKTEPDLPRLIKCLEFLGQMREGLKHLLDIITST